MTVDAPAVGDRSYHTSVESDAGEYYADMLRSILRAIVVVFAGGWGIGAVGLAVFTVWYIKDRPAGAPWALEAAFGVGAFLVGIALLRFAWWMLYPPPQRPATDDIKMARQQWGTSPPAFLCILALAAIITVAVLQWSL